MGRGYYIKVQNCKQKDGDSISRMEAEQGRTYRGLYLSCHMKGAAALPMQYAESMIALTVTRFVWPAVTLESQDRESTKIANPPSQLVPPREERGEGKERPYRIQWSQLP
jgi:hypothetical protein